jgi:phosphonopyruvate decarboxylase
MKVEYFVEKIKSLGITSMIGVPDSTLKQFCDYMNTEGKKEFHHYVPANEGAATGMAAGVYLATGKPACVYMQNSGLGNVVNPVTSIANAEVYDIPMLFITGWRGEPGKKDEPQHKFMGKITESIYDVLDIHHAVIGGETTDEQLEAVIETAGKELLANRQFAIIVKKDTFEKRTFGEYTNEYSLVREEVIAQIVQKIDRTDVVISTTGKISREVYEQSDKVLGSHEQDFLTVGGMGHASMIAFGYAVNRPDKRVYCIDGDGAVLMHMGSLAFLAKEAPENLVHICINNEAHESVGGMPTGAAGISYAPIAQAAGYERVYHVDSMEALLEALDRIKEERRLTFLEVMVGMGSREDLGRPKESAVENKKNFMQYHEVKR